MSSSRRGRYVVALDFGTTYSGFAYSQKSDPEERVLKFYDWKDRGGRREYCKTITALYYEETGSSAESGDPRYELKGWGWSALQKCMDAVQKAARGNSRSKIPDVPELSRNGFTRFSLPSNAAGGSGASACYVEQFKLDLLREPSGRMKLPGNLNTERLIVDYLGCLRDQAMAELRSTFSNNLREDAVEWCLTVPSIWTERSKQVMRSCAQKAGLVKDADEVDIILEPEGASMYCHRQRKDELNLQRGDRLLVADIGGGTIDLVVHTKTEADSSSSAVEEVVPSYGEAGGGTFVDAAFFQILAEKIGCLDAHLRREPSVRLAIDKQWQLMKTSFQGEETDCAMLSLPASLRRAWRKHEKDRRRRGRTTARAAEGGDGGEEEEEDEDDFSDVMIEAGDFRRIFDPEVEKVIGLIRKQVRGVKVVMLVGGLASSEYVKGRVRAAFQGVVEQIVVPLEPGSAICHGALLLHLRPQSIESRMQTTTYGLAIARAPRPGDPPEFIFRNDDGTMQCNNVFDVLVKRGERVPRNKHITQVYRPGRQGQKALTVKLYSCRGSQVPNFITDEDCRLEGSFELDMSGEGIELDRAREVEVSMVFGNSVVAVSACGRNFGDGRRVHRSFPLSFV